ncbi:MAG: dockerin type I repeat-containing protein [Clostridiales bacterium]|nr:dockerin type I repeat-containing protein [Clostridiales bacterium]
MKLSKLFSCLVTVFLAVLLFSCIATFAEDTDSDTDSETAETVPTVVIDEENTGIDSSGNVTLVCTINNPVEDQQVSIMVAEYTETSGIDYDNPIYLNQYDYDSDAGSFTTTFTVDVSSDKTYYVRVGGTNITTAVYMELSVGDDGKYSTTVVKGDVNIDGSINVKDVILLRQYIAKWSSATLTDEQIEAANVNGDDSINVKDVILLRQYIAKWSGIEFS